MLFITYLTDLVLLPSVAFAGSDERWCILDEWQGLAELEQATTSAE